MKVGILTFHFNYNYGAVLQTYASVAVLRALGHEVEVVNHIPPYFEHEPRHFRGLGFTTGQWPETLPKRLRAMPRRLAFDRFRAEYLPLGKPVSVKSRHTLASAYDVLYVGSDQVWNLNWMNGFDGFYFCDFLSKSSRARAIAYAPCFGTKVQPADRLRQAGPLLRQFHAVGVRNRMSADVVKDATDHTVKVVCDPTMLHDFNDLRRPLVGAYILVYSLAESEISRAQTYALELAKKNGIPIWFIANDHHETAEWADRIVRAAGPAEWLNLIAGSFAVVTDSFHGAIFAMKYNKPLQAYSSGWRAGRLVELFEMVGVPVQREDHEDALVWSVGADNHEIFGEIHQRVENVSRHSCEWLSSRLEQI